MFSNLDETSLDIYKSKQEKKWVLFRLEEITHRKKDLFNQDFSRH